MRGTEVPGRRPWTGIGGFVEWQCVWRAVCAAAGLTHFTGAIYRPILSGSGIRQSDECVLDTDTSGCFRFLFTFSVCPQKEALTKVRNIDCQNQGSHFLRDLSDASCPCFALCRASTARWIARYPLIFIKRCAILSPVAAHKNKVVQGLQGGHRL